MTIGILVVCEDRGQFEIATCLVDRTFAESEAWIADSLDYLRKWIEVDHDNHPASPFLDWHKLDAIAKAKGVRMQLGHFAGKPSASDALATRKALAIARKMRAGGRPIDGAVLVRDADHDAQRSDGIQRAVEEASRAEPEMYVVYGVADLEIEAWFLAGFDPENAAEEARLTACKQELGCDPRTHAHELRATHDHDRKSVKRVLRVLTGEDPERKTRCCQAPLDTLHARGASSGLGRFLDQTRTKLLPLLTRSRASS